MNNITDEEFIQLREKFWKMINKQPPNNCWIWSGAKMGFGYGHLQINNKHINAHRLSWEIHFGEIPRKTWVLHKCDNPPCVNPKHLFLGTPKQNAQDREKKGRGKGHLNILKAHRFGEYNWTARLTEKQVLEIKKLYKPYVIKKSFLARKYHVSEGTIESIIYNLRWKHLR